MMLGCGVPVAKLPSGPMPGSVLQGDKEKSPTHPLKFTLAPQMEKEDQ